jgi:hypothetical protein
MSRPGAFFIPQFDDNVVVCIEYAYAPPIYLRLFADKLPAPTRMVVVPNAAAAAPLPIPTYLPCRRDGVYKWIISNPAYVFHDVTFEGVVVIRHTIPISPHVAHNSRVERSWMLAVLCKARSPGPKSTKRWTGTAVKAKK